MSALATTACLTVGGTNMLGAVGEIHVNEDTGKLYPAKWLSAQPIHRESTADPAVGLERIYQMLDELLAVYDCPIIVISMACPIIDGLLAPSGNLGPWKGIDLKATIQQRYPDKNIVITPDGPAFIAVEWAWGILSQPGFADKNGVVIGIGTGNAFARLTRLDNQLWLRGGEWGHQELPISQRVIPTEDLCICNKPCMECFSSGKRLKQLADEKGFYDDSNKPDPSQLSMDDVKAELVPGIALGISNLAMIFEPSEIEVIIIAGLIPHLRPGLVDAIKEAAQHRIGLYVPMPQIVGSEFPDGGLLGVLAYSALYQQGLLYMNKR